MPISLPWKLRAAAVKAVGTVNLNVCAAGTLFPGLEGLSHLALVVVEIVIANMYWVCAMCLPSQCFAGIISLNAQQSSAIGTFVSIEHMSNLSLREIK